MTEEEDANLVDLYPHSEHNPDRSRELAVAFSAAARALNYATDGGPGLVNPADAYDVLGRLTGGVNGLAQTMDQLSAWMSAEIDTGRAVGAPDADNQATARKFREELGVAADHLRAAHTRINEAQVTINAVRADGADA